MDYDDLIEPNERFSLQLTGATSGGTPFPLGNALGVAIIVNDDVRATR